MTLISLKKTNTGILFTLAVLICGISTTPVAAQESVVLSVSPTLFDMTANPTQNWASNVRVINANAFPITVYAEAVNFAAAGEVGQGTLIPVFDEEAAGETLAEWIDIDREEIVIPPEQTVSVPFTIAVPDDAPPGGHFAAILIGTRSFRDSDGQAMVETSQVVTSLVFLRVAGDIDERGLIREFRTEDAIYESADATFSVRFENTGNVHIQPQGEIEVRNMWGQLRGTIPINKNSQFGNVLPESIRTYTFSWSSSWSLADVGRHTAVVTLAYGDTSRQFVNATTNFWLIPWRLLLVAVTVVGAFVWLFVFAIKLYVRRMLQLAGVTPELHKQQRRRVSVTAPLEAGILDLREELKNGTGSRGARLWSFVLTYRVATLVTMAVLVFVGLLAWYVVLLITSDYTYEISIEQPDGTTVPIQVDQTTPTEISSANAIELTVINQSNVPTAIEQLRATVDPDKFNLIEVFEPTQQIKERSVLVYDPMFVDQIPDLQAAFPGVLISSFSSDDPDSPPMVLYVGTDLLNTQ